MDDLVQIFWNIITFKLKQDHVGFPICQCSQLLRGFCLYWGPSAMEIAFHPGKDILQVLRELEELTGWIVVGNCRRFVQVDSSLKRFETFIATELKDEAGKKRL